MPTLRAFGQFDIRRSGVQGIAPDAVECRLASLQLESSMIPPVVPQPKPKKHRGDDHAVDHGASGEVEHTDPILWIAANRAQCLFVFESQSRQSGQPPTLDADEANRTEPPASKQKRAGEIPARSQMQS
jgi:hypothetical protein